MNDFKSGAILFFFSWVPYLLVAGGYSQFVHGDMRAFWPALGTLVAVRFFFIVIEWLGGILTWRLYGKRRVVAKFLEFLRANNYPKRFYHHDNFLAYLTRIQDDRSFLEPLRMSARQTERELELFEEMGMLLGMRMHSASEAALEIHSPRGEAKHIGQE